MNRPNFIHGVVVAALLAIVASAVIATLTPFIGFLSVVRLVIPALALAYLVFLFRSSDERTGRLTTLFAWGLLAAITWWVSPPLGFYVLIHVGAIWLVRSLYFYAGVFPSLLDFGLSALSVFVFGWALERTGSVFMGVWCLFLVQAVFVAIPRRFPGRKIQSDPPPVNDKFEHARRQADQALQQIFTN
ncbi:MAG: hypothetical protein ACR2Q3_15325 [Woeseiaceae bacterium]